MIAFIMCLSVAFAAVGSVCSLTYLAFAHRLTDAPPAPQLLFGSVLGGCAAVITLGRSEDLPHWLVVAGLGGGVLMVVSFARFLLNEATGQ